MKNNKLEEKTEALIIQAFSAKNRKIAIGLVSAGIVFCTILLLPPVQSMLVSFINPDRKSVV